MLAQRMLAFSAVLAVVVLSTCSIMRAPYWGIGVSFVAVSGFIEQGGGPFHCKALIESLGACDTIAVEEPAMKELFPLHQISPSWQLGVLCVGFLIVLFVVIRNARNPHRAVYLHGHWHPATIDWSERAFTYDSTGHGHFVHVRRVGDSLLAQSDSVADEMRPADNEEKREWTGLFTPGPIVPICL